MLGTIGIIMMIFSGVVAVILAFGIYNFVKAWLDLRQ